MTRRRTAFAIPFVAVTACRTPTPVEPKGEDLDDDAEGETPAPVTIAPEPTPHARDLSSLFVDEMPALETRADYAAKCAKGDYHHCPDPATYRDENDVPEADIQPIRWIAPRDGGGARVRFAAPPEKRYDLGHWHASIDRVPCRIIAVGGYEAECWTTVVRERFTQGFVFIAPDPEPIYPPPRRNVCCTNPPPPPRNNPPPPLPPVEARIIQTEVRGDMTVITLGVGSEQGVTKEHRCMLEDLKLPCQIIRLQKRTTIASVRATPDQINAHPRVVLTSSASDTR